MVKEGESRNLAVETAPEEHIDLDFHEQAKAREIRTAALREATQRAAELQVQPFRFPRGCSRRAACTSGSGR
jgi:hypothetical protein